MRKLPLPLRTLFTVCSLPFLFLVCLAVTCVEAVFEALDFNLNRKAVTRG